VWRDEAQTIDCIYDRNVAELVVLVADHAAEMSFVCELDCSYSKTRAERPVERSRRSAALQMSKNACARFLSSAFGNFAGNDVADSAEPKFAAFDIAFDLLTVFWPRPFRHHDKRPEPTRGVAFFNRSDNFIQRHNQSVFFGSTSRPPATH